MKDIKIIYDGFFSRFVEGDGLVELVGWLVIIDYKLFLVSDSYVGDYKKAKRVEFFDSSVIFSVADKILPLGGGESFIFHKAKVIGWPVDADPPKITPVMLTVEERPCGVVSINFDKEDMEKNRVKYEDFLKYKKIESTDWLDFYKDS